MSKIILSENTSRMEQIRRDLKYALERYNAVFEEFDTLDLGEPNSKTLLYQLRESAENVVRQIYENKLPSTDPHTGLSVDRSAMMKNLKLPDLKMLINAVRSLDSPREMDEKMNFFSMDEETGRLVLDEQSLQAHFDAFYRIITDRAEIKQLFDEFHELAAKINGLQKKLSFISTDSSGAPVLSLFDVPNKVSLEVRFRELTFKDKIRQVKI